MKTMKFTTSPEWKKTESFLNWLKPVQEEQKQVILRIIEKIYSKKLWDNKNFISISNYYLDDFLDLIVNTYTKEEILNLFSDKINFSDIKKLINIINKTKNIYIPDWIYQNLFSRLEKEKKNFPKEVLGLMNLEHYLFNSRSNWSKVFDELIKKMDEEPNKNLYSIMSEKIDDVFWDIVPHNSKKYNEKEIKENQKRILNHQEKWFSEEDKKIADELWIDKNSLRFTIYLRYWSSGVSYPEIAEFIIMFFEKCFTEWYSKYFKNIDIVPRNLDIFPDEELFKNRKILKVNVAWTEKFEIALQMNAISDSLSHWTIFCKNNSPQCISSWSIVWRENSDLNIIKSSLELESYFDDNYSTKQKTLFEILKIKFDDLQRLEEELDKID